MSEVDVMIAVNATSTVASLTKSSPNIKIMRDMHIARVEPALHNEPPALIQVEVNAKPLPLWVGFIGVSTELNDVSPVSLLPFSQSGQQQPAKLGAVGSRLLFELAPAYLLIGLVPSEPAWFTVSSPDPLRQSQFAALAWKMKATYSMGKCKSEAGNVVLLFEVNGKLVVATE